MIGDPPRKSIALKYYLEGFEDAYNYFYFNNIQKLLSSIEEDEEITDELYQKIQKIRKRTQTVFEKIWKIPDPQYLSLNELNTAIKNIGARSDNQIRNCLDNFQDDH